MHKTVAEICLTLDGIAERLFELNSETDYLTTSRAWYMPSVNPASLSQVAADFSKNLKMSNILEVNDSEETLLSEALSSLQELRNSTIDRLYSDPERAVSGYLHTLNYVSLILQPIVGWTAIQKENLPSALVRKIQNAERLVDKLTPDKIELTTKIANILDATAAAEALPTTLQELKDTLKEVRNASASSSEHLGIITENRKKSEGSYAAITGIENDTNQLAQQVSEAYRIATTTGLAAAFDNRALKLGRSVYVWVAGLTIALGLLALVGYSRISAMKEALDSVPLEPSRVWFQIILSILGLGAPVWFAWIATKQISQRFRLSEDYAFKASVAKAYEGYRREAVRIDPDFEKALFASALTRLDEAPLRLMELSTHGSPMHELANSAVASSVISTVAGIKDRFSSRSNATKNTTQKQETQVVPAQEEDKHEG